MAKDFKTITELNPTTLMIVDSLNLGFRWKHSGQLDFVKDYLTTVDSLARSYKAGKVIIGCDMGSSSYRKGIYPEYKANRKEKQELQTPEDAKAFELFFEEYLKVLDTYREQDKYPVLRFNKVECDDIAAYIVKTKRKYNIKKIILISSDADWDLLVDADTMRFSYVTRKEVRLDNWYDKYDCEQEQYISIKCLQGDSGDNVPGVPGIGPIKAAQLIKTYGSTYDIIASLPITSKYKYIENLNKFGAEALILNYKLMDLLEHCDEAIGEENCKTIDKILGVYLNEV